MIDYEKLSSLWSTAWNKKRPKREQIKAFNEAALLACSENRKGEFTDEDAEILRRVNARSGRPK